MFFMKLLGYCADVNPSLSGHVVERGYRGTSIGLTQTFLPLSFTIPLTVFCAVGAQLMVQVAPVASKTIGKGKTQTYIVIIRLGNVGVAGYQFTSDGRGHSQLLRWG